MKISARQHFIFWVVYIVWDLLHSVWMMEGSKDKTSLPILMQSAALGAISKIVLFYFLFYFIQRRLILGKKRTPYLLAILIPVIAAALFLYRAILFYIIIPYIYKADMTKLWFFNLKAFVYNFLDLIVPVCVLLVYEMYRFARAMKEREGTLEKEKLRTELSFLKAQINPHFLFNVLGTIHALSRYKAPEAADATMKLSQLMRFMLYDAKNKYITIAEEVKLLADFIELERVRFSNKLTIEFKQQIEDERLPVAPLLLLPFVENAFKYSSAESRFNAFVHISLTVKAGILYFETENSVEDPVQHHMSTHIGLANITRQLELLYPGHLLVHEKRENTFFVSLQINLEQDEKN